MTNDNQFNGSDSAHGETANGAVELEPSAQVRSGGNHSYLLLLAARYRRLLIYTCLGSMVVVFLLTFFVISRKYQATVVLRPVGQNQSGLSGLLQSTGLTNMTEMAGVGIDSDLGTNQHDPDELVAILNSYTFAANMIKAEHLEPRLVHSSIFSLLPFFSHKSGSGSSSWAAYRSLSARFDCDNSIRTGNITLTFYDKDPAFARYVLESYVDRLRDQLRAHDIQYCKAAAASLQQAAAVANDPMLRDDLYDLAARQIKKIGTAQANSDFAFVVLENPYSAPYPVRPWILFDTLAAGVVVPVLIFLGLIVRDWVPRLKKDLADVESESERLPGSIAAALKTRRRAPTPEEDRPYTQ
jgi:hypothetical protein